jgi:hypothetical protein
MSLIICHHSPGKERRAPRPHQEERGLGGCRRPVECVFWDPGWERLSEDYERIRLLIVRLLVRLLIVRLLIVRLLISKTINSKTINSKIINRSSCVAKDHQNIISSSLFSPSGSPPHIIIIILIWLLKNSANLITHSPSYEKRLPQSRGPKVERVRETARCQSEGQLRFRWER